MANEVITPAPVVAPTVVDTRAQAIALISNSDTNAVAPNTDATVESASDKPSDIVAKPEPISPQLAQLARREKYLQQKQEQVRLEQETKAKELDDRINAIGTSESLHQLAKTDLVAFADKIGLTPQQREEFATALFYSAQPEDKRPEDYKKSRTQLSESEQLKMRLEKQEKELADYKAQVQQEREESQNQLVVKNFLDSVTSELTDATPLTQTFVTANPRQARADLWQLAVALGKEHPDTDITTAMVAERYEEYLNAQIEPFRKVIAPRNTAPVETKGQNASPRTLSNVSTASPSRPTSTLTDQELRDAAIALLK